MAEPMTDQSPAEMLANLPAAMRERQQWLVWRFETFDGDKKPRKVPYYVNGQRRRGQQGSDDDRAQLASFDQAVEQVRARRYDGAGFAFLPGDGLIGIDLDGAIDLDTGEVSKRCQSIISACGSYTELSPSGRGVHIIVQGTTTTFKNNDVGVEVFCGRQFFTCTGRRWPGTPEDVRPIADSDIRRLRATVRAGKAHAGPAAPTPAAPSDDLAQRLEGALQALSPDMPHDDWVDVGMAIKAGLGDPGFRLWDYWSSKGTKYPGTEALRKKWDSFRGSGITEATVFGMAKAAGWKPPRKPRLRPVSEPSPTPSAGSARKEERVANDDAPVVDLPLASWRRRMIRSDNGWKDCRENVFILLVEHPALRGLVGYDEFAHRVMKLADPPWDSQAGEWTTSDDYLLGLWITEHIRLTVRSEATLVAGVAMAAFHARYHPVLTYLDALPAWDGVERLPYWLHECLGAADSTYSRMVGTWFVMGMVQRVRVPGCQMDYMVVLEGAQGKRKSTALRTLVGNDDWFADTPIKIGDKDAMLSLAGKWLYEVGELDSFNRAEVTAVKQYVSSRVDRVREPFARRSTDRPRSGVFAGSTNQSEYFKDPTGARRFWPVACEGDIDVLKLAEWRDQLFAEAIARLASDDPDVSRYYPTREETERYLVPEQEQREIVDPWFERLAAWLNSKNVYGDTMHEVCDIDSFTSHDLLTKALGVPVDRIDGARQMSTRVGIAMHKLGWEKRRDAAPPRLWRYWRPGCSRPAAAGGSAGGPAGEGDA
jgi:predicted P-loop ATPase